jgi:hypothetical protein
MNDLFPFQYSCFYFSVSIFLFLIDSFIDAIS